MTAQFGIIGLFIWDKGRFREDRMFISVLRQGEHWDTGVEVFGK